MKHILYVRFMAKLWTAFDGQREWHGFINDRGRAQYFENRPQVQWRGMTPIEPWMVLDDVNNQIDIIRFSDPTVPVK